MDGSEKCWFMCWSAFLATVCIVTVAVASCICVQTHLYTSHGYTRTTPPGGAYPEWVKEAK